MDDFYKILQVSKTATALEIKRSYLKLASQYHPDKNKDNLLAEEKFKQISEAYSILSREEKKRDYDRQFQTFNNSQTQSVYTQAPPPPPKPPDNLDTIIKLSITLEEAHLGCLKNISFERKQNAKIETTKLSVTIPKGIRKEKILRIQGQSHQSHSKKGDLFIKVKVKKHPLFNIKGHDLIMELPLSITDAILGKKMSVPTLTGKAHIQIQPGAYAGQQLKLKGQGLYCADLSSRGDLILEIKIDIPNQITEEEKQWFKKFRENEQLPQSVAQFNIQYRKLLLQRAS